MLITISIVKVVVSILLVLGLVYATEKFSPKTAGIIGGTVIGGTSVSLFFFGYEHGIEFVQAAVPWVIAGIGAEIAFYIGYFLGSQLFESKVSNFYHMTSSIFFGFIFFLAAGYILSTLELSLGAGIAIFLVAYLVGNFVLSRIKNGTIKNVKAVKPKELFFRVLIVAILILFITNVPQYLGSKWAGVFSAFATATFPTLLILQYKYRDEAFPTVLKNISWSISSLVVYVLSIYYFYEMFGIYLGTILGIIVSSAYLVVLIYGTKLLKLTHAKVS